MGFRQAHGAKPTPLYERRQVTLAQGFAAASADDRKAAIATCEAHPDTEVGKYYAKVMAKIVDPVFYDKEGEKQNV